MNSFKLHKLLDSYVVFLLYRVSLVLGYIPKVGSNEKVSFIPKFGQASYVEAKAYKPTILKAMSILTEDCGKATGKQKPFRAKVAIL